MLLQANVTLNCRKPCYSFLCSLPHFACYICAARFLAFTISLLQYYDEYGRKMTQKEAFRQLSWKFHGKAPSKKRRERRMLEVEKQMNEKSKDRAMDYMGALQQVRATCATIFVSVETCVSTNSIPSLWQAQEATKSAHIVLSGVNAIKSSDISRRKQPADRSRHAKKKKGGGGGTGIDTSVPNVGGFISHIPL